MEQKHITDLELNFPKLIHQHSLVTLFSNLRIFPSLELDLISTSISKLLEILASNIIFLRQKLHCHLQSLYFKLYLNVTYMFHNIFA